MQLRPPLLSVKIELEMCLLVGYFEYLLYLRTLSEQRACFIRFDFLRVMTNLVALNDLALNVSFLYVVAVDQSWFIHFLLHFCFTSFINKHIFLHLLDRKGPDSIL